MGDTYFIKNTKCAYCAKNNDFVEEAMKSGHVGLPYTFEFGGEFVCNKCKEKNEIVMDFVAVKSKSRRKLDKIMEKGFDQWNEIKKKLETLDVPLDILPRVREVWMCSLGKNLGFEQNGSGDNFSRPMLVLKKFNNQMFWVLPLSTKQKGYDFYYNFTDPAGEKVSIILAQLRLMSIKRFQRALYELPKGNFTEVRSRIMGLIQSKPRTGRGFSTPPHKGGGTL